MGGVGGGEKLSKRGQYRLTERGRGGKKGGKG